MTELVKQDPRTKQHVKDALYNFLYVPTITSFQQRKEAIIQKNSQLLNNDETCFVYRGVVHKGAVYQPSRKMNRLVKELHPIMDQLIGEMNTLDNYELPYVLGFISQVLNASNVFRDYLLVLPESVHAPLLRIPFLKIGNQVRLTEDAIARLKERNALAITLMKQRQVLNLLA